MEDPFRIPESQSTRICFFSSIFAALFQQTVFVPIQHLNKLSQKVLLLLKLKTTSRTLQQSQGNPRASYNTKRQHCSFHQHFLGSYREFLLKRQHVCIFGNGKQISFFYNKKKNHIAKRKSCHDYCYKIRSYSIFTMECTYDQTFSAEFCLVICKIYSDNGACTDYVAVVIGAFSFGYISFLSCSTVIIVSQC